MGPPKVRLFVRHQQLQPVSVGISEVDAMRIALAAADSDAGVFKRRFDALVIAGSQAQRHVIDFAAAMDVFMVVDFEERDALVAAFQETLPVSFMINFHAEKLDIEFSRPREILDMHDDVVDGADFKG